MRKKSIFIASVDENNRLSLPKDIKKQILQSLKSEKEDKEIKRAVNLLLVQVGKVKGLFLIPYIYYIRHFPRIVDKMPVGFFSRIESNDEIVSEDMDNQGRVYIPEKLLKEIGLINNSTGVAAEKVSIVNSICGWTIWSKSNWIKVKNKITILHQYRKAKDNLYVEIDYRCCFADRKGGLKKIILCSPLIREAQDRKMPDFIIVEIPPSTYIFPCTSFLYKNICNRSKEALYAETGLPFSVIDYRFTVPEAFSLVFSKTEQIGISFRKFYAFFDFLRENISPHQVKGSMKAIFRKEDKVYTLADIAKC